MKRHIFLSAAAHYRPALLQGIVRGRLTHDKAEDLYQDMLLHALDSKHYLRLNEHSINARIFRHLKLALRWECLNMLRRKRLEAQHVVTYDLTSHDDDLYGLPSSQTYEREIVLCPYCHLGVLNHFGACAECHTILGSMTETKTIQYTLDDELQATPDLDLYADVQIAMNTLTPFEQRVTLLMVHGASTMEDMAGMTGIHRQKLWRTWCAAKGKLQLALFDYGYGVSEILQT